MAANSKFFRSAGWLRERSDFALTIFLLLAATIFHINAQETAVSMKIDIVAWGDDIGGLSIKPGSEDAVTALGFRYSQPVNYNGPAIMEIHQSGGNTLAAIPEAKGDDKDHQLMPLLTDQADADPRDPTKPKQGLALELEKRRKKSPTLVALAALPSTNCRRATVLLAPADGGTFVAYVIDDDPAKLPPGQLRLHNLSPIPIALRFNGSYKEIQTRGSIIVPVKNQQLFYELAYKHDDKWAIQENNIIPVRRTEQTQMIVLKSDNRFFLSADGASGGFLQVVTLRRRPAAP